MTRRARCLLSVAILLHAAGSAGAAAPVRITVNPSVTHQVMVGWEATAWANQDSPEFPHFADDLYDLVVDDLGINRLRLEVRSGCENDRDYWTDYLEGTIEYATWRGRRYSTVNDNADPFSLDRSRFHFSEMDGAIRKVVLPIRERVEARGERLYVNLNYVAFTAQIAAGLAYEHDDPEEYGEFILATFLHLREEFGWVPDAVEVLLEPDNVSQWNGTLLGQAIVATASRLEAEGFLPEFIAPSNTYMGNAVSYFDALAAVPGALDRLAEISYHRYGGATDTNLAALASRALQHGKRTSMLEWWSDSNGHETLHKDLKSGLNSAWQQAVVIGHYDVDTSNPTSPVISPKPATRFTRQYFRFIRSGAQRIGAESESAAADPLAFVNADGRHVVVVKASQGVELAVEGLPARSYGITYTTAAADAVELPEQAIGSGEAFAAALPAAGVLTIYGTASAPPDVPFRRGDSNADGILDVSDAVATLGHLFLAGEAPPCADAADSNDDGAVDIADSVTALLYLFSVLEVIPEPVAACGVDPTADNLGCRAYSGCGNEAPLP